MMDMQEESLNRVLRCELTAVNQQFTHILVLREWGQTETAARITQTDDVDFANAMRIIDYLIETETPLHLASERFTPGTGYRSILLAEQVMEQRLAAVLEDAACRDDRANGLIAVAREPREAYADWLADRLAGTAEDEPSTTHFGDEVIGVFDQLIAMVEQSMVHAFVHWHRGDADNADAAWATSGAAMMHATDIVRLFAAQQTVPVPNDIPALQIADEPAAAIAADRQLAGRCASEAANASQTCTEPRLAETCRQIAAHCLELSTWDTQLPHPAIVNGARAFSDFEATLKRFVWQKGSTE